MPGIIQAIIAGFKGLEALGAAVQQIANLIEKAQATELGDLRRLAEDNKATIATLTARLAVFEAMLAKPGSGGSGGGDKL